MYCQNEQPLMIIPDEEGSFGLVDRNEDQHYLSAVPTLYEEGDYQPGKTAWVDRGKIDLWRRYRKRYEKIGKPFGD